MFNIKSDLRTLLVNVHLAGVDLKNALARLLVGQWELNLAIKASRPQQCRIQNINTVSGGDNLKRRVLE